jgi:NADPH:quinone reductase-like Zn-dependent oxidoreductase
MRAVLLTEYGSVEGLKLREVPDPEPGPNEIKVRMAGASINPIDWKMRSGSAQKTMPMELPAILGRDVSGTVVAVGPGATTLPVGTRVMGNVPHGYAEMVVAPAAAWTVVPPKMDLVDAGAFPLVLLTGAQLVEDAAQVREGDVVLVTGAVGSVGRVAVFVAKQRGARVLAGVRTDQKAAAAMLQADGVFAIDDDRDIERIPPLDALADTVGGETALKLVAKVKKGGRAGGTVGEPPGARDRGLDARGFLAHPDSKRVADLAKAVAEGRLTIPIAKRFPLAQAAEAQTFAERGAAGKVLLTG